MLDEQRSTRIGQAEGWQPAWPRTATSFRGYVASRQYDFGRGREASWAFIAFARGDPDFPDVQSWAELQRYLDRAQLDLRLIRGARSVWRSFTAYRSRHGRER